MNFPSDSDPDNDDDSHPLDGTAAAAARALARLAVLAGQPSAGVPVLELLLGDVVTSACVEEGGGAACLVVTARLPPGLRVERLAVHVDGIERLWHADEGCHVALRRIPLAALRTERALMDAVLETADAAREWHAAMGGE